jgi:O-methyltransferase
MGFLCKLFRKKKHLKVDNEHLLAGDRESIELGLRFSMSSWERLFANVQAVRYMADAGLEGDLVECGVWRGGSMMTMAQTLLNLGDSKRHLHLYDTFSGMSAPVKEDGDFAIRKFDQLQTGEDKSDWCFAGLDEVKSNLAQVAYPEDNLHFIQGKIEDTVPNHLPEKIALLRLDMDWYEPTLHAMRHMFPRLQSKGVLIVDDYGHWEGCRRAVDETLQEMGMHLLLSRTDYTGRMAIKP